MLEEGRGRLSELFYRGNVAGHITSLLADNIKETRADKHFFYFIDDRVKQIVRKDLNACAVRLAGSVRRVPHAGGHCRRAAVHLHLVPESVAQHVRR